MILNIARSAARRQCASALYRQIICRCNTSQPHISRYESKIQRRLKEEGVSSFDEFKARVKENKLQSGDASPSPVPPPWKKQQGKHNTQGSSKPSSPSGRTDGSPIRPLESFLDTSKLFSTPHTSEQIAALWTGHHVSKRGLLSAVLQVDTYRDILVLARHYPVFIIPLARPGEGSNGQKDAYEFYYLQWNLYSPAPDPKLNHLENLFVSQPSAESIPSNPASSTLIFTPLVEYKLHQSYATPHLALTFYPDLAQTHGIVLMRGEMTPSTSPSDDGNTRYRLGMGEAQMLALSMQKFYLGEGEKELRGFHENPDKFEWEKVVKICYPDANVP